MVSASVCEVHPHGFDPGVRNFLRIKIKPPLIPNTRTPSHHTPDTFPMLNSEAGGDLAREYDSN